VKEVWNHPQKRPAKLGGFGFTFESGNETRRKTIAGENVRAE